MRPGKGVWTRLLPGEGQPVRYTRRIRRVKTARRVVAMTFDDGPTDLPAVPDKFRGKALTEVLLDLLGEYDAQGTFNVIGDTGGSYPDRPGGTGRPNWSGVRFDHYPDINLDDRGGAANNEGLIRRMLAEGHQISNHSYQHILFGKAGRVFRAGSRRVSLENLGAVTADLTRLHTLLKDRHGYEMTMARPPHYVDRIDGIFTAFDAYDLMDYQYLDASYDGGGWRPLRDLTGEVEAMAGPMGALLAMDPDALCGQIIFEKDGSNMARRTPVAFGLKKQLDLLHRYGYQVVTVGQLMEISPFSDLGPGEPGFEKLMELQKTRAVVGADNRLRLEDPMTWGELAMLLAPRREAVDRRLVQIRKTGKYHHPHWGAMDWCAQQGIMKHTEDPQGRVDSLPRDFFSSVRVFDRRHIYEAFLG